MAECTGKRCRLRFSPNHVATHGVAEYGRVGDPVVGARDQDSPVSSGWRRESSTCGGTGQFLEEEDAVVGKRGLARSRIEAAARSCPKSNLRVS